MCRAAGRRRRAWHQTPSQTPVSGVGCRRARGDVRARAAVDRHTVSGGETSSLERVRACACVYIDGVQCAGARPRTTLTEILEIVGSARAQRRPRCTHEITRDEPTTASPRHLTPPRAIGNTHSVLRRAEPRERPEARARPAHRAASNSGNRWRTSPERGEGCLGLHPARRALP